MSSRNIDRYNVLSMLRLRLYQSELLVKVMS